MNTLHLALFFFFFVGSCQSTIYWRAAYVPDAPIQVAEQFLATLFGAAKNGDFGLIDSLIDDSFVYEGCRSHYSKQQLLKVMSSPTSTGTLSMTVKSASFDNNGSQVNFNVLIKGFESEAEFEVLFKLAQSGTVQGLWILKNGKHGVCPRKFVDDNFTDE